jgi:mannose-6-phosphate isomerase-like protein (cupin superfamily)
MDSTIHETKVHLNKGIDWEPLKNNINIFHKEIIHAQDSDGLGIRLNSILWEKIDINGKLLPHYHNVAEIIHIVKGKVQFLVNGKWQEINAGDTILVPENVVHSVENKESTPAEQISIFIPLSESLPQNVYFKTDFVNLDGQ